MITDQLAQYYARSASQHEGAYTHPDYQDELAELRARVVELLRGHTVLELACGAGYWTAAYADVAASVHATDINPEMLALAQARGIDAGKVSFSVADAYALPVDIGRYSACFAGFWWSHVKREEQERFLAQLRARLGKDTLLVLIDETFTDEGSATIARTDAEGNTHQIPTLDDGSRYEIVRNFPSDSTLRKKLASSVREIKILRQEHFWLLSCRLK